MLKNLISCPILARLAQIWPPKNFQQVLSLLDFRNCRQLSMYAILAKKSDPNVNKMAKNLILGLNQVHWAARFFFKNLAPSVTRYYGQLSSCKYQKKLIVQTLILRKLSDGRKDRQTYREMKRQMNRQTEDRDFTGRCPTDVERPTNQIIALQN